MTDKTDGGPAFPALQPTGVVTKGAEKTEGMTLRDWFAGQALAGISANPEWRPTDVDTIAQDAYAHADAMLKEREK